MTWTKITRGHYRLVGTPFEVQSDGYEKSQSIGAEESTGYEGYIGGEWAVIDTRTDDNLDWFPTMREARTRAEREATRIDQPGECSMTEKSYLPGRRITREQAEDMSQAHAEGFHAEVPREGCPDCEGQELRTYPRHADLREAR